MLFISYDTKNKQVGCGVGELLISSQYYKIYLYCYYYLLSPYCVFIFL